MSYQLYKDSIHVHFERESDSSQFVKTVVSGLFRMLVKPADGGLVETNMVSQLFVMIRDSNEKVGMLVSEIPYDSASYDKDAHCAAAERRATEQGFQVLGSFDENDLAATAVDPDSCIAIPMTLQCF